MAVVEFFVLVFAGAILAAMFGFQTVEVRQHKARLNTVTLRHWLLCNAIVTGSILVVMIVGCWRAAQRNPNLTKLGQATITGFFAIIVAAVCWAVFVTVFRAVVRYTRVRTILRLRERKRAALLRAASKVRTDNQLSYGLSEASALSCNDTAELSEPDDETLDLEGMEDLPDLPDEEVDTGEDAALAQLNVAQLIRGTAEVLMPAGVLELFPEPEETEAQPPVVTEAADEGPAPISVVHSNIIMYPEIQVVDISRRRHRRRRTS